MGHRSVIGSPLSRLAGLEYVAVAVLLFSTSPVLIRAAAPLTAYEITFGRMAIAALVVGLTARVIGLPAWPRRSDLPRFALYGLIAALHFLLYIASLSFTTVAHSLSLVYTAPLFVTLFAALILNERLPARKWAGIPVVAVGIGILAGFEPRFDNRMLEGDLLALGSAICFGLYSIAGRHARTSYPLLTYAGTVYALAALWLLPIALLRGVGGWGPGDGLLPWSPSLPSPSPQVNARALAATVALGVGPLAIGHTLYNASLRRAHPTLVNLVATQEVTGGIVLGMIFLREFPSPTTVVGVVVTLIGIALVLRD